MKTVTKVQFTVCGILYAFMSFFLPMWVVLLSASLCFLLTRYIANPLMDRLGSRLSGSQETLGTLAIEPPTRCQDCGSSLWIGDRDDNGVCDDCWARKETVTFEEDQRRGIEELKAHKKLQEEIANRGLFL